jgi:hypothetical protein
MITAFAERAQGPQAEVDRYRPAAGSSARRRPPKAARHVLSALVGILHTGVLSRTESSGARSADITPP